MPKLNTWFLTDFHEIENVDYLLRTLWGGYIDNEFTSTGKDQIDYRILGRDIELPDDDLGCGTGFKNGYGDDD